MTTVVNKKYYTVPPNSLNHVYIGRPGKWGNPFTHRISSVPGITRVHTREEAVRRFEEWIRTQPELIEDAKRHLKGKVLVCWCKPLSCHGDVLARIAEEP